MTLLKKIGTVLAQIVGTLAGLNLSALFGPKAGSAEQVVVDKLDQAAAFVVTAEGMLTAISGPDAKTGPQKLAAATPFIAKIVQNLEVLSGKKLKNEALFTQGAQSITSGLADVLNSYE